MSSIEQIKESRNDSDAGGRPPVQSLARGLEILGQFTASTPKLSLTDISRRTGVHRATVHRFVKTLEMVGYLTYDPETALYSIGPAWAMTLYELGSFTVLADVLATDLRALADSSRETVTFGVRQGENVHVVHANPSSRSFIPKMPAARLHPLNETWNVHAQIILAFGDEKMRERMLSIQPIRYTEHTVVDRAVDRKRLERVRLEAVAYDREEHDMGTCAVGVPIILREKVVAAIALAVPVERFTEETLPSLIEQLRAAAAHIGKRLDAREIA